MKRRQNPKLPTRVRKFYIKRSECTYFQKNGEGVLQDQVNPIKLSLLSAKRIRRRRSLRRINLSNTLALFARLESWWQQQHHHRYFTAAVEPSNSLEGHKMDVRYKSLPKTRASERARNGAVRTQYTDRRQPNGPNDSGRHTHKKKKQVINKSARSYRQPKRWTRGVCPVQK